MRRFHGQDECGTRQRGDGDAKERETYISCSPPAPLFSPSPFSSLLSPIFRRRFSPGQRSSFEIGPANWFRDIILRLLMIPCTMCARGIIYEGGILCEELRDTPDNTGIRREKLRVSLRDYGMTGELWFSDALQMASHAGNSFKWNEVSSAGSRVFL